MTTHRAASDDLCTRVKSIQKKQRSGHIAPPTPTSGSISLLTAPTPVLSRRSLEAPDYTPLLSRPIPLRCPSRSNLPSPAPSQHSQDVALPKRNLLHSHTIQPLELGLNSFPFPYEGETGVKQVIPRQIESVLPRLGHIGIQVNFFVIFCLM
jgi:hypothetical protein